MDYVFRRMNYHSTKVMYFMFMTKTPIQIGGGLSVGIKKDLYLSLMVRKNTCYLFIFNIIFVIYYLYS